MTTELNLSGKIIEDKVVIGLPKMPADAGACKIEVTIRLIGAAPVTRTLLVPADFYPDPELAEGLAEYALVATLDWDGSDAPVDGVEVASNDAKVSRTLHWGLNRLFPKSEQAFEDMMHRKVNRPKSDHTLYFMTRQILDHYTLDVGHLCVASVIYAYRSIDFNDAAGMAQAIVYIRNLLERSDVLPEGDHPRKGRQLLRSSLFTALRHLYLATGNKAALLDTLDQYVTEILSNRATPLIVCVNFSPAALMYGYILLADGRHEEAEKVFFAAYRYYRDGFSTAPEVPILFYELGTAHTAAAVSFAYSNAAKTGIWAGAPEKYNRHRTIFDVCNRVALPAACDRLRHNFRSMLGNMETDRLF